MSRIPRVLIIKRAINQFRCPNRADFHKDKPFQIKDQTTRSIIATKNIKFTADELVYILS